MAQLVSVYIIFFLPHLLISIPNNNYGQSCGLIEATTYPWRILLAPTCPSGAVVLRASASCGPGVSSLSSRTAVTRNLSLQRGVI